MALLAFLLSVVVISLSGVMAPGPVTAATLAAGARSRHAGAWIATGHGVVEFPLVFLLAAGVGAFLAFPAAKAAIGIAGGLFLLLMGGELLWNLPTLGHGPTAQVHHHPFFTGVILTGANPYFILWWFTVGLAMVTQAMAFGILALGLFAVVHWLCDLVWLDLLSLAAFHGAEFFGRRAQRIVFMLCAVALLAFGVKFLWDAAANLAAKWPAGLQYWP
ncbi:MAG: LysE family transporter [Thermoguttaceae bacterium]